VLRSQGRIVPHPVFPDSEGPAARRIEDEADVRDVIELMRLNYDRAVARHGLPGGGSGLSTISAVSSGRDPV
jgi:luciferase-like monooxygenase